MLILVGGLKDSGKDYFSDLLVSSVSGFKKVSYANEIKIMICNMFGIKMSEFENAKKLRTEISIGDVVVSDMRKFIQNFGTEVMQSSFGVDVWSEKLFDVIQNLDEDFIISDFRFKREYEFLLENYNGKIITIWIENSNLKSDKHQSENDLLDFDFDLKIDNSNRKSISLNKLLELF